VTAYCGTICADRPIDCVPCATGITQPEIDQAFDAAEQMIHEMLGRRFGTCSDSITICTGACCRCNCNDCARVRVVVNDRMPITQITSATFTPHPTVAVPIPVTVPLVGLTIRNFNEITFPQGTTCFPDGVVVVNFDYGVPYPNGICLAVRDLAAQFIMAISCNCECTLPANVQSYSRGDISYNFISQKDLQELGLSGIASLDALVRSYGKWKRPTVYSPDISNTTCGRWFRVTA